MHQLFGAAVRQTRDSWPGVVDARFRHPVPVEPVIMPIQELLGNPAAGRGKSGFISASAIEVVARGPRCMIEESQGLYWKSRVIPTSSGFAVERSCARRSEHTNGTSLSEKLYSF